MVKNKDLFVSWRGLYVPQPQENSLLVVGFNVENGSVLKVDAVIFDVAVFSNRAALVVKLVNTVLELDSLLKVLGFADVRDWRIRIWNSINDTLHSLFKWAIFQSLHKLSKC